jgi:hypothetical protein
MAHLWFKLVREDHNHQGLHLLPEETITDPNFDESPTSKGGLWFCHREDIPRWTHLDETFAYVYEVHLLPSSLIVQYEHKCKTDQLVLKHPTPLAEFLITQFEPLYLVACDPWNLRFTETIQKETYEIEESLRIKGRSKAAVSRARLYIDTVCMFAVQKFGHALRFVVRHTMEVIQEAIRQAPRAFQHARWQLEELCIDAVQRDGMNLAWVKQQTPAICLAAVQQNGHALQFVKEQTPELMYAAVQQTGHALQYCKERSIHTCYLAYQQNKNVLPLIPKEFHHIIQRKDPTLAERLTKHAFLLQN